MNEIMVVRTVLTVFSTSKRKAHSDHNVINDTAIAVGTSFACAVSEIGFCASGRSGFQKGYGIMWLNFFRYSVVI